MQLKRFKYTIPAAEHCSFRKAAESLDIEQSVVSSQIRELEDELGISLVTR